MTVCILCVDGEMRVRLRMVSAGSRRRTLGARFAVFDARCSWMSSWCRRRGGVHGQWLQDDQMISTRLLLGVLRTRFSRGLRVCVQIHRRLGAANTLVRRATCQGDYSNEDNVNAVQPRRVLLRTRVSIVFLS